MSNKRPITSEELSQVKYGQLLDKFTELGIPEVWKAGSKKTAMIEKAIEQIRLKSSLEAQGLDKDQIEEKIAESKIAKQAAEEKSKLEQAVNQEVADKQDKQVTQEKQLTRQEIEFNLNVIGQNLKFGIPSQKVVLLKKRDLLMNLLKDI